MTDHTPARQAAPKVLIRTDMSGIPRVVPVDQHTEAIAGLLADGVNVAITLITATGEAHLYELVDPSPPCAEHKTAAMRLPPDHAARVLGNAVTPAMTAQLDAHMADEPTDDEIDLDAVVALVKAEGIDAYVEQTGGGIATIFAGRIDDDTRDVLREGWAASAGPGWFDGPGWSAGRAHRDDFYVGLNDDGETLPFVPATNDAAESAALVVAVVRGEKVPPPWGPPAPDPS